MAGGRSDRGYRCSLSLRVGRNRRGVSSHRWNRGCDVVVGSAATIRVFVRFRVRKTKENGSGSRSAFGPAHGTNAGPVRFGPTRTRAAALVSAPHACSRLGLTCTRLGSVKTRSSAPSNPAAQLGGLIGRLGSSAW